MLVLLFFLLFASPAFAQSETDLLKLENLNLKIELTARTFKELMAERDQLKAKIDTEASKTAKETKTKTDGKSN